MRSIIVLHQAIVKHNKNGASTIAPPVYCTPVSAEPFNARYFFHHSCIRPALPVSPKRARLTIVNRRDAIHGSREILSSVQTAPGGKYDVNPL